MGRIKGTGANISFNDISAQITPSIRNLNAARPSSGVGWSPQSGQISLGHMYGAWQMSGFADNRSRNGNRVFLGVTTPVPNMTGGTASGSPSTGYSIRDVNESSGDPVGTLGLYRGYCPSTGDNLRFYARQLTTTVPWAGMFESPSTNALATALVSLNWSGSLSYTHGVWFVGANQNSHFSHYNPAISTILSASYYAGALVVVGGSSYQAMVDRAQFHAGSYSIISGFAMFGIGSWARNSQCNHYHRIGGTGITFLQAQWQWGSRGAPYQYDTLNQGPGYHYSDHRAAFKNSGTFTFPATHSGPGGGNVVG